MSMGLIMNFKDLRDFRVFKVRRAIEEFEGGKVLSESVFSSPFACKCERKVVPLHGKTKRNT